MERKRQETHARTQDTQVVTNQSPYPPILERRSNQQHSGGNAVTDVRLRRCVASAQLQGGGVDVGAAAIRASDHARTHAALTRHCSTQLDPRSIYHRHSWRDGGTFGISGNFI